MSPFAAGPADGDDHGDDGAEFGRLLNSLLGEAFTLSLGTAFGEGGTGSFCLFLFS